jgi:hypothetical protein
MERGKEAKADRASEKSPPSIAACIAGRFLRGLCHKWWLTGGHGPSPEPCVPETGFLVTLRDLRLVSGLMPLPRVESSSSTWPRPFFRFSCFPCFSFWPLPPPPPPPPPPTWPFSQFAAAACPCCLPCCPPLLCFLLPWSLARSPSHRPTRPPHHYSPLPHRLLPSTSYPINQSSTP